MRDFPVEKRPDAIRPRTDPGLFTVSGAAVVECARALDSGSTSSALQALQTYAEWTSGK